MLRGLKFFKTSPFQPYNIDNYVISGGTLNDKICSQKELFAEEVFLVFLVAKLTLPLSIWTVNKF